MRNISFNWERIIVRTKQSYNFRATSFMMAPSSPRHFKVSSVGSELCKSNANYLGDVAFVHRTGPIVSPINSKPVRRTPKYTCQLVLTNVRFRFICWFFLLFSGRVFRFVGTEILPSSQFPIVFKSIQGVSERAFKHRWSLILSIILTFNLLQLFAHLSLIPLFFLFMIQSD